MSDDDAVGYGHPPRHTRFRKGRSGNPKGRPKGARNFRTELREEMSQKVRIREGDTEHVVSKQRAVLKRLVNDALKGDVSAIRAVIDLRVRHLDDDTPEPVNRPPTAEELEILEAMIAGRSPGGQKSPKKKAAGRRRSGRRDKGAKKP